jgi:DNA-directed RNA polymerase subunit RPC12/RpoP
MWQCVNCKSEIADKYLHCWQCGTKHVPQPKPQREPARPGSAPKFASYEELAPDKNKWLWRRGPLMRIFWAVSALAVLKVISFLFLGAYGNYIILVVAVCALIVILWRHFHRHPSDDVGIKLH